MIRENMLANDQSSQVDRQTEMGRRSNLAKLMAKLPLSCAHICLISAVTDGESSTNC
jgi:hypothetical protein